MKIWLWIAGGHEKALRNRLLSDLSKQSPPCGIRTSTLQTLLLRQQRKVAFAAYHLNDEWTACLGTGLVPIANAIPDNSGIPLPEWIMGSFVTDCKGQPEFIEVSVSPGYDKTDKTALDELSTSIAKHFSKVRKRYPSFFAN